MKNLYQFYWDCGRMGSVEGLFVADDKAVDKAYNKRVYLGEVLGKHSEISGVLKQDDITLVSDDQSKITWLVSLLGENISGFNPLEYMDDYEDEDEE